MLGSLTFNTYRHLTVVSLKSPLPLCPPQLLVLLCGCVCEPTDARDRRQYGSAGTAGLGWKEGMFTAI